MSKSPLANSLPSSFASKCAQGFKRCRASLLAELAPLRAVESCGHNGLLGHSALTLESRDFADQWDNNCAALLPINLGAVFDRPWRPLLDRLWRPSSINLAAPFPIDCGALPSSGLPTPALDGRLS